MARAEAFLQAILANPTDDAIRLVYADWLDEHGGEVNSAHADLIRVQCELAALPEPYTISFGEFGRLPLPTETDARRTALLERQRDLMARHREAWLKPLPAWA